MSVKNCGSADFRLKAIMAIAGAGMWGHLADYFDVVLKKNISQISVTLNDVSRGYRDKKKTVSPVCSLQDRSVCDPEFSMGLLVDSGQIDPLSKTTKKGSFSLAGSRLLIKVRRGYMNVMTRLPAIQSLHQFSNRSMVLQSWKRNSHGNPEAISPSL